MRTEDLDIVYCLKEKPFHEEFRYSLRSLKNLPHKNVWLYGACPDWANLEAIKHIEVEQNKGNKWFNVSDMLEQICQNNSISEDFIWFNDDFFVLKKIDQLDYFYDRTLSARVTDFYKLGWQKMNTSYTRRLQVASRALKWNKQSTLNYELHLPMIFNRKKLQQVIKKFPQVGAKRSLYGNCFVKNSIERNDIKIYTLEEKPKRGQDFVSTSDLSFIDGEVGKYLRRKFKEKSEYEK